MYAASGRFPPGAALGEATPSAPRSSTGEPETQAAAPTPRKSVYPQGIELSPGHRVIPRASSYPQGIELSPGHRVIPRASSYPQGIERNIAQIAVQMASDSKVTTIKEISGLNRGIANSADPSIIGGAVPRPIWSPVRGWSDAAERFTGCSLILGRSGWR
jgi:hypothetical protein